MSAGLIGTAEAVPSGVKIRDFIKKTVLVAGGLEAHLANCTKSAVWDEIFAKSLKDDRAGKDYGKFGPGVEGYS